MSHGHNNEGRDHSESSYTNNRRAGWSYDANGNNTSIGSRTDSFDAAGQMTLMTGQRWVINHYVNTSQAMGYDGDGGKVQEVLGGQATYYLRSSVLDDEIITEINGSGQKTVGYVYSDDGGLLARQSYNQVTWKHTTPVGTSRYDLPAGGGVGRTELDPLGANIGLFAPPTPDTGGGEGDIGGSHFGGIMDARWSNFFDQASGCTKEGVAASCSGSMAQTNMDAEMRAFFGDSWYDLPGNDNEIERAEAAYARGVYATFAAYNSAHQKKQKPKLKPGKKLTPKQRKKKEEQRKRDLAKIGNNEDTPQNTKLDPQSGGGVAGTAANAKTPFEKKLDACTKQLFGVELQSFTRSRHGHNGSFTGYGADAYGSGGSDTQITVVNEVNSYTSNQLGAMAGLPPNSGVMGLTGPTPSGYTPYRNFTASGLTNSRAILATQVHELGNSLRRITGVTMDPNSPAGLGGDTDPGTRLERCVFGGEIDSHGHLHHF